MILTYIDAFLWVVIRDMKSFLLKRYNYSLSKIIYEEKMNICYYSDKILTPN
jgi:hypothetical protein